MGNKKFLGARYPQICRNPNWRGEEGGNQSTTCEFLSVNLKINVVVV